MLAHTFDAKKHYSLGNWFMSEKLDGMRCFWDGGITAGMPCSLIPFANSSKDYIRVNPPRSTGLWSRYWKPVQAPLWWTDKLPKGVCLDGELYIGPGCFQDVMSTCRKLEPVDSEWERVRYHVFDMPCYSQVFADGEIRVPNMEMTWSGVTDWLRMTAKAKWEPKARRFEATQFLLQRDFGGHELVIPVHQEQLPATTAAATTRIESKLGEVIVKGGEGVMIRHPNATWTAERSHMLLKVKPYLDCEVTVTGYVAGRRTELGSKLLGLMGALVVDFGGKRLELSGFTDEERVMTMKDGTPAESYLVSRAGEPVDLAINPRFPVGSRVTIRYRELSRDGLPKEARYLRPDPAA